MDLYVLGYIISGFLILLAIIMSLVCEVKVNNAYNHFKEVDSSLDMTGAEFARKLAHENNLDLTIRMCEGKLSDHYNPKDKSLNISKENYYGRSIASHSIVAHEFGHALQDAKNYKPLKVRQAVIKISNFTSTLFLPILLIGIFLELFLMIPNVGNIIIFSMVGIYGISVIASLVTLPVEYNASKRAKKILQNNEYFKEEEMRGVDAVLNSAALTYVASLFLSLAYFLRIIFRLLIIFRRD